jgi:Bacteriodetes cell division protein (FtsL-like)
MEATTKKETKGIGRMLGVFDMIAGDNLRHILTGIPYLGFLVLLAFLHIANNHLAESYVRKIATTEKDVHNCRWQYMEMTNNLMKKSRLSVVARSVEETGLKELRQPPYIIETKK